MTFDELWEETWKTVKLPKEAKMHLPQSLSEKTKRKILNSGKSTTEIAKMFETIVDEINHGSIATIDELVNKQC